MKKEPIWSGARARKITSSFDIRKLNSSNIWEIKEHIYKYEILAIQGQDLNPTELIHFAKLLGDIQIFGLKNYSLTKHPEIVVLNNQKDVDGYGAKNVGFGWHSDGSYSTTPLHLTLLYGVDTPDSIFGGDTLFIDMVSALQNLPPKLKAIIRDRKAFHEIVFAYRIGEADVGKSIKDLIQEVQEKSPTVCHPCVLKQPFTGGNHCI
jgi:alpha-ketoglutarate-dependent taurine dioxygenase